MNLTSDNDNSTRASSVECNAIQKRRTRNLIGFWLLGLCNNYAYVVMLSAAFDLLHENFHKGEVTNKNGSNTTDAVQCNDVSTGAILLADILPSLFIKLVAPFIAIKTNVRALIAVSFSAMSFIITSISEAHWITFLGVICAALSSGLGEVTFLSYSSYFEKDVVSTWSSGTGGAGVVGALSYASLAYALSVRHTLQVMLVIPVLMAVTFWLVIDHPPSTRVSCKFSSCSGELDPMLENSIDMSAIHRKKSSHYTLKEKISLVKPLLKYMIPLSLVYFAEYFINQGLMELMYFKNASNWLSHETQYRWYQVDYQLGVLISRSSVNLFQVKRLWVLPVLQVVNAIFLFFEVYYSFLPSIWIVLVIIFYEGLLGGCAYVNTFYQISEEVPEKQREFSMGVASLGDATGIAFAGAVAVPVHRALCNIIV